MGIERSLITFNYKKHFQLVTTIHLSTYNDIFEEKIKMFFWKESRKSHIFLLIMLNLHANSFLTLKSMENDLLVFFDYF